MAVSSGLLVLSEHPQARIIRAITGTILLFEGDVNRSGAQVQEPLGLPLECHLGLMRFSQGPDGELLQPGFVDA